MGEDAKGLLVFLAFFTFTYACPELCTCKWKYGKQTVDCIHKGFLEVPQGMDPGTQVLEFSRNNVQTLQKELFVKLDLVNLQKIFMADCGIVSIDDRTFVGLSNLVELDLSNNLISAVPTEAFVDCPSLMRLSLNANPIGVLQKAAFKQLSYLNTLELRNCMISKVYEGAFRGLHNLEWLHLNGNKLRTLGGLSVLPDSLKGIELQDNPWNCDCRMLDLHSWLLDFKIPHNVEPVCNTPSRLSGRHIKSVTGKELACLPDVTPTAFYLELGEGKNISLVCQVHAVPEAKVSWWFQGQMLQNDSTVAPGVHLIYYVEEGGEDKKSELFIFNANEEDNGTFACNAQNYAGKSEVNFTIRIILKEEPVVAVVTFPFEHLLIIVGGITAFSLVLGIIAVVSIVRCRRSRRRHQKREQTKEMALQYQQNSVLRDNADQPLSVGNASVACEQLFAYSEEVVMSPITTNQLTSPASLKRYQLEQNPDLINDTESVAGRRRDGDGESGDPNVETELIMQQGLVQFPVTRLQGNRTDFCSGLVDREGYPVDYGLPKLAGEGFYRTLPYNRSHKRQSAANPPTRYSREAEFLLSRSIHPAAYEHYCPDVRYTADGYPVRTEGGGPSSPSGGSKTDSISLPCCSNQTTWSTCVPSNLHNAIESNAEYNQSKYGNVNKRCVGAQTEAAEGAEKEAETGTDDSRNVLAESPDEGYEGETAVV